jgi:hypothetical protein
VKNFIQKSGVIVLLMLLSIVVLFLLLQKSFVFSYLSVFSIFIWIWVVLMLLFLLFLVAAKFSYKFLVIFKTMTFFRTVWFLVFYFVFSIFLLVNIYWQIVPINSSSEDTSLAISSSGVSISAFPTTITDSLAPEMKVVYKNNLGTALSYADIQNNVYAFELWEKLKSGDWALEFQGYQFFRSLADVREITVNDFGTIEPGESKELTLTLSQLNVYDTAPIAGSPWSVIGTDQTGSVYSKNTGTIFVSCGTGIFHLEFGKVANLYANVHGLMIADLVNPLISNEITTGLGTRCQ